MKIMAFFLQDKNPQYKPRSNEMIVNQCVTVFYEGYVLALLPQIYCKSLLSARMSISHANEQWKCISISSFICFNVTFNTVQVVS